MWSFRVKHKLTDRLPEEANTGKTAIIFAAIVIIELAVSVFMLRESNGLSMVVMTAVVYVVLNAVLPFAIFYYFGKWSNYKPAEYTVRRIIGYISRAVAVVVGLLVNLMLAHLRESKVLLPPEQLQRR